MPFKRDVFTWALFGVAGALALAALLFVFHAFSHRPDNPVEAELVFEALRVARGRPLYVDPAIGAWEDGGPPSRFYVLYTPLWPWLIGHLAGPSIESIRATGRLVATGAWLVVFVAPVVAASRAHRRSTAIAALLGLGVYFLARNAPSATPDTLAVALACIGLVRVARRGHVDALTAALLVAAPFVKPSCVGIVTGIAIAHVLRREPGRYRAVSVAVLTAAVLALFCNAASSGAWLTHLVRSTGQPLTFLRFVQELGGRGLVLGLPHVVVAVVAIRRRASLLLVAPLLTSIAWSSFAMAKHGSGTQYWIEPTMAAVVTVAFLPAVPVLAMRRGVRRARALYTRCAAATLALVIGVVSVPAYSREIESWVEHDRVLALVRRHCPLAPGEVIASSEVSLELALDGRLLVPDWQTAFLARRGAFPAEAWRSDLRDPRVRWLVLPFDPAEPPADTNDARIERSAFRDVLRPVVEENFVRDTRIGGFLVFRRRQAPEVPRAPFASAKPAVGERIVDGERGRRF